MLGMAKAGRLMARQMRSRGALPAASEACSSGRSIARLRLYRRSPRAGCEAYTRADKMTAESTARPLLTQCQPALMTSSTASLAYGMSVKINASLMASG